MGETCFSPGPVSIMLEAILRAGKSTFRAVQEYAGVQTTCIEGGAEEGRGRPSGIRGGEASGTECTGLKRMASRSNQAYQTPSRSWSEARRGISVRVQQKKDGDFGSFVKGLGTKRPLKDKNKRALGRHRDDADEGQERRVNNGRQDFVGWAVDGWMRSNRGPITERIRGGCSQGRRGVCG
jgi:hypothetical protein